MNPSDREITLYIPGLPDRTRRPIRTVITESEGPLFCGPDIKYCLQYSRQKLGQWLNKILWKSGRMQVFQEKRMTALTWKEMLLIVAKEHTKKGSVAHAIQEQLFTSDFINFCLGNLKELPAEWVLADGEEAASSCEEHSPGAENTAQEEEGDAEREMNGEALESETPKGNSNTPKTPSSASTKPSTPKAATPKAATQKRAKKKRKAGQGSDSEPQRLKLELSEDSIPNRSPGSFPIDSAAIAASAQKFRDAGLVDRNGHAYPEPSAIVAVASALRYRDQDVGGGLMEANPMMAQHRYRDMGGDGTNGIMERPSYALDPNMLAVATQRYREGAESDRGMFSVDPRYRDMGDPANGGPVDRGGIGPPFPMDSGVSFPRFRDMMGGDPNGHDRMGLAQHWHRDSNPARYSHPLERQQPMPHTSSYRSRPSPYQEGPPPPLQRMMERHDAGPNSWPLPGLPPNQLWGNNNSSPSTSTRTSILPPTTTSGIDWSSPSLAVSSLSFTPDLSFANNTAAARQQPMGSPNSNSNVPRVS
mmetsp:Transcript_7634/g.12183  ORF Transcript_7634/g.12183 Transcript_7634/m.12183 type:complete len:532 (-) Transcript_7634:254-1849(-)|eukprot:CAMPEP_0184647256 /NCGR_PEP_ID=MMETSP0308-20130426/4138_1 /TAXON_ID=38269 /ORGANISM="Gloeochaete witrockiana, Strain SAG 46.84" /LENGTH=531 /DNA_ID=CAMNT_0027078063 /DNA_START=98 /DNA_END=1693 /DNA_ORIENTATION=-